MKSLMLKLLTITLSSTLTLAAASKDEESIVKFLKSSIATNDNFQLKDIKVRSSQKIENLEGWKAYFVRISLHVKKEKRDIDIDDIVFSDGSFMTKELFDLSWKKNVKELIAPRASASFYDKTHLIEGDLNAKHKLLVFSDPLCPFCMDFIPEVIDFVKKHPKDFGLFYYHLPLTAIHPHAQTIIKAMMVAEEKGVKDVIYKTYNHQFDNDKGESKEVLEKFNKVFKTDIGVKDIEAKSINDKLAHDVKIANELMTRGTPTLFINGKLDKFRNRYVSLVNEYEGKK